MNPVQDSESEFLKQLQKNLKLVIQYENVSLLNDALEIIPSEELSLKATMKLSLVEKCDVSFEDLFLLELVDWFKSSFFSWVDVPKCHLCGETPKRDGLVPPTAEEKAWNPSTVERYFCNGCKVFIRFPRYNDPKKLLETRCGRCGEWANCFTLLCRALGYDTRLVIDWNDHVWTEVFSFAKKRWLHCDPCENVCDKPLLYEIGWKKQISYIIAFSKDEIQDVTWRYTCKFAETMARRNLCSETWLLNVISKFIDTLQMNVSSERKQELCKRRALELAEFLTEPKPDADYEGRTSGSLAWRIVRGEIHLESTAYMFVPTDKEIAHKYLHVKYSCALDQYIRISHDSTPTQNWAACAFEYSNIFRKVELDWKQVYLSRTEGYNSGSISWKFKFDSSGLVIETLRLRLKCATFENGKVNWSLTYSAENLPTVSEKLPFLDTILLKTGHLKGYSSLILTAELLGGTGRTAWQHTQLFRQSLHSTDYPFEIEFFLDNQK